MACSGQALAGTLAYVTLPFTQKAQTRCPVPRFCGVVEDIGSVPCNVCPVQLVVGTTPDRASTLLPARSGAIKRPCPASIQLIVAPRPVLDVRHQPRDLPRIIPWTCDTQPVVVSYQKV